jgi:hypothetical protein
METDEAVSTETHRCLHIAKDGRLFVIRPPLGLRGSVTQGTGPFCLERKMHPHAALQFCARWILALKGNDVRFGEDEATSTDAVLNGMAALLAAFVTAQIKDLFDRKGYHYLLVRIPDQVILNRVFVRLVQEEVPPELASLLREHEHAAARELVEEYGETWRDDNPN